MDITSEKLGEVDIERIMSFDQQQDELCSLTSLGSEPMSLCSNSVTSDTETVYSEDYTDMAMADLEQRIKTLVTSSPDTDDEPMYDDRLSVSTLEFECETGEHDVPSIECLKKASKERDVRLNLLLRGDETGTRDGLTRPVPAPTNLIVDREDREFDFVRVEPVRRCSSLKSCKTPPDTPHRKKEVRFADVLGLDLESVRHIMNVDDPPIIPTSATKDLDLRDFRSDYGASSASPLRSRHLCACFSQPGCSQEFTLRVRERKVSLESFQMDDANLVISGIVRVANIAYQKSVIVRYTVNGWLTFFDSQAKYVDGSNDGITDRFYFVVKLPEHFGIGSLLEFSVMYSAADQVFWDSNFGGNYRVECYSMSSASDGTVRMHSNGHTFY